MRPLTKEYRRENALPLIAAVLFMAATASRAAVFYTETFDSDTQGWVDRDPGEMAGTWTSFGNPAGSVQGTFNAQVFPSQQTDAWEADSGSSAGQLTGNYWADVPGFTGWKFSFFSSNVLPSTLTVKFGDGTNVFSYAATWQVMAYPSPLGNWLTIGVPLDFSAAGWFGISASAFSNALGSVNFIDIEVTRNGSTTQTYFLDNFALVNDLIFVPEPASGLFWFGWALVFGGLRRKLAGHRQRSPYALPVAVVIRTA
jgi:hypothetical protein